MRRSCSGLSLPETQREIALIVIGEEVERYRKMGIDLDGG